MSSDTNAQRRGPNASGGGASGDWLVEESDEHKKELQGRVKLVTDVAIGLERALKSFRQFGVRHKTSQGFIVDSAKKMKVFHDLHGELPISVFGCDLLYEGESVYSDQDLRQSFPFLLFRDGVQRIVFEPGVEPAEIQTLCMLLRDQSLLGSAIGIEDDLVTLLWDADLKHLRYVVSESFKQDDKDAAREEQRKRLVEQLTVDADAAQLPKELSARFVRPPKEHEAKRAAEDLDLAKAWERGNIIATDESARSALAAQVDNDETLLRKFLEIVFSEILDQKDKKIRRELIGFVRDFAVEATRRDRLPEAIGVLRALGDLARLAGDDGKRVAQEILGHIATPEVLAELMHQLELADDAGTQDLLTFLALVPPKESRELVPLISRLNQASRRRALCQLLAERLGDDLAAVGDQFREADEALSLDLIHLLKSSPSKRARVELLAALDHLSHVVRRAAFDSIRSGAPAGDPTLVGAALLMLDDEDRDMRRLALLSLPRMIDTEIARRLRTIIGRDSFDSWDYYDKRRTFLAFAAASGKRANKELVETLQARAMFSNDALDDRRCCAAFALAATGDEAMATLLEGEAKRMFAGKKIVDACENALAILKFKKTAEPEPASAQVAPVAAETIEIMDTSHLPRPIWDVMDVDMGRPSLPGGVSGRPSTIGRPSITGRPSSPPDPSDERASIPAAGARMSTSPKRST
ncbi:MAG: HEAT repeat domain-containing protein [Polyangiales bacterium]